ncbi:SWIM zinc finger family protein [Microtetraspora malaysiensis]|uniref:SWIM zinc finger family protein n=1 Tax=Microtetraspora malaysiensis TaxID=161358 RepID=UPI00082A9AD8|nr:SWIM zinc finger family protein [Microtetraspora malaysiensis]
MAGGKSYDRGVDYVDAVDDLQVDGGKIFATVYGTEPYEVELTVGRRGLDGACECPWGQEGNFCKHCVAAGFDGQWLRLARSRAESHPADAIPVYERLAESKISLMKNDAYAEAAGLAVQITKLYDRLGREADGRAYGERLRTTHKRKRNFMAELQRRAL